MADRLRMGLIGGGPGSFIGPVHRIAAELDGQIALVAGAFSGDPARSKQAGEAYGIEAARAYPDVATMLAREAERADKIDFVTIATPNNHHLSAACQALAAGFAVVSDKPATATLDEARTLRAAVEKAGCPYALTYTYTGYPLVREARERIRAGAIGRVRKVVVEYPQGWLARRTEDEGNRQAAWRVDPALAGQGGCIGDIGVHAFNLAEFVTGLKVERILADLGTVVPGRLLDDDVCGLLRFAGGARGVLMASQISIGELNGLHLRIYGETGSLEWRQEHPNGLWQHFDDGRTEQVRAGDPGLSGIARDATRLPGGHPEGYLEAFANVYRDVATILRGGSAEAVQGIEAGVRSMAFIDNAVRASRENAGWVEFSGQ